MPYLWKKYYLIKKIKNSKRNLKYKNNKTKKNIDKLSLYNKDGDINKKKEKYKNNFENKK